MSQVSDTFELNTASNSERGSTSTGATSPSDSQAVRRILEEVCQGFGPEVNVDQLFQSVNATTYAGISDAELWQALIMATRTNIEFEPAYTFVAARLLLISLYNEALSTTQATRVGLNDAASIYKNYLSDYVEFGVSKGYLDPRFQEYDLVELASAIHPERDQLFAYQGLQILYDRYFLQDNNRRFELPQLLWMRVAMGLAFNEEHKEARAIEFYELLSQFYFTSATPTLFNAGTAHPQLSSCYLTTVDDDLFHIFKCIQDNALLSKWAGGLGNDWTRVRALGAHIKGTNGISQGIIPFLKVVNDTAVAVNQGGKRKGAVCAYIENWHLDIEEFLDLRKNTGDDRRRTHDMHIACWISDLFMKRVERNEQWTLFSPDVVSDLHDLYGKAFEQRYEEYERMVEAGQITHYRRVSALDLWRKMLTRLFETGHPWITFKDPSNVRSPQDHAGVVHSSNLCTEILLNTSNDETAVCNLGSINLAAHIIDGKLNHERLQKTVRTAVRMLDNVIDINYYPTDEARNANLRHRPVGLGLMAFQDALYKLGVSYASEAAVEFADRSMEAISYYAILASSELAAERGTYGSYQGSKWDRGILPIDSIAILEEERGQKVDMDRSMTLNWDKVRTAVKQNGMRNSNVMAIAPTATISSIVGVSQSIEPSYKNLYVKSNLSGEFTIINSFLVDDLKRLEIWDRNTLEALKYYDGSLQEMTFLPEEIRQRYLTAFDIEPRWLIACASRRQKWIDMGQSIDLYLYNPSGKKLSDMYQLAWNSGLKTTYYLRTLAATQVEKSTVDINRFGIQPRWMKNSSPSSNIQVERENQAQQPKSAPIPLELSGEGAVCNLGDDCEACQ
ncbi:ribonucleoside-diphosphate reductase subunit alpha [Ktedonobacter robiniae]|uniref:Ribonucleoside-diphosphate reductase n=1 Tax=Ktedonobacter robiniae TaxID=2778365 RepID=A0ABQ3UMV3_9CHLR|nr:ribonucleoside-diphosphate reductase subunit alpha [Ktedonobacter robiniae]GHO53710.1 ribonucleoside-diphosphate reductase subunit alpha [Ktedonobacter robiniae]